VPLESLACDESSCVPSKLRRRGRVCDRSSSLLRWDRQLMRRVAEERPSGVEVPVNENQTN
jgi:hypothetical protein